MIQHILNSGVLEGADKFSNLLTDVLFTIYLSILLGMFN